MLLPALRQLTGLTHLALDLSCFYPTSWHELPELTGLSSQLQSPHLLNHPGMPAPIASGALWCSSLCRRLSNLRQLTAPDLLVAAGLPALLGAPELELLQVQAQKQYSIFCGLKTLDVFSRCLPAAAAHPALQRVVIDSEWEDPDSIRAVAAAAGQLNPDLRIELATGPLYTDDAFLEAMGIFIFWDL